MSGDIVERLRQQHTIQYGWKFGELVTHTENNPDPHIVGRMNRCAICEQWSPCDVRDAADEIVRLRAEVKRLRAAGDALAEVSLGARPWITPLFAMEHGDRISGAIAAWEEARREQ